MFTRQRLPVFLLVTGIGVVATLATALAGGGSKKCRDALAPAESLAAEAGQEDFNITRPVVAAQIQQLRQQGYAGLEALTRLRHGRIEKRGGAEYAELQNLDAIIDKVAGQKFAVQSRLFWHTSLAAAQKEALASHRPILSLRMLGRLDEDLSCANSRFFRTTLYPDPKIADHLRESFVLHWNTVRQVPVVTVDFGEGRRLRQPLTGNSVHMVLDQGGNVIDALPGLVSPQAFFEWLSELDQVWRASQLKSSSEAIKSFHANRAGRRRAETPLAIGVSQHVSEIDPLDRRWLSLAASRTVVLAGESRRLLQQQRPPAENAMALAVSKGIAETPLLRLVQPIEPGIARDTALNLYVLQTKLDDWLAATNELYDPETLTDRIYADLFLMPLDDPWLGLSPADQFAALDRGGRIEEKLSAVGGVSGLSRSRLD